MGGYIVAGASSSIVSGKREQDAPATDLINAQSAKLSALKTHKKGLMQQLFPFPEEVEAMSGIKPLLHP